MKRVYPARRWRARIKRHDLKVTFVRSQLRRRALRQAERRAYCPGDNLAIAPQGGLADEGEDIEVIELGYDEAIATVSSGAIMDGKTVLLQHLQLYLM